MTNHYAAHGSPVTFLWSGEGRSAMVLAHKDDRTNVQILTVYNVHPEIKVRVPVASLDLAGNLTADMLDAGLAVFGKPPTAGNRSLMRDAIIAALSFKED